MHVVFITLAGESDELNRHREARIAVVDDLHKRQITDPLDANGVGDHVAAGIVGQSD